MNKRKERYYNYVVNDLVKKTEIDYVNGRMYTPFPYNFPITILFFTPVYSSFFSSFVCSFSKHCKNIYGLNDDEVKYVWNEYRDIIKDKINNG